MPEHIQRNNESEQPKPMQLEKAIAEVFRNVFMSQTEGLGHIYMASLKALTPDKATFDAYNPVPVRESSK